jgi:NADH dehydrogenase [ubiquinone] 1 alpha subcomplex assembly factor 7
MTETSIGYQSTSKYSNTPIIWTENIRFVPSGKSYPLLTLHLLTLADADKTPFIVAHEFFDALPIHAFQSIVPSVSSQNTIQTPTGEHTLAPEATRNTPAKGPQWREMGHIPHPTRLNPHNTSHPYITTIIQPASRIPTHAFQILHSAQPVSPRDLITLPSAEINGRLID